MSRGLGLVAAIALFACRNTPEPARPPLDPDTLAFVDVNVVPLDREGVLAGQTVIVRKDTIAAVGPSSSVPVPPGARVIDGRGKFLLPGLADMHAHLLREADLLLYLARGVTTVRNMWGAPMHVAWRDRVAHGELLGPTIHTAGPIVDGDPPVHDGSLVVRDEASADRAIALHSKLGYDFVKVYSNLSSPAFERLTAAAKSAGVRVVGHVPRSVGLERAIDGGLSSVEHLSAFSEALQTADSPVAGKFDRASRAQKLDHIDDAKIPPLVKHLHDRGAFVCPTRVVMAGDEPKAALTERLARPETRYVGAFDRVIWQGEIDRAPEQLALDARSLAFADRMIAALHEGKADLLVGTDTANPFVVPGFSVHEELAMLVRDGLSPYDALTAATRNAARFLGTSSGVVAPGMRADLLLLEGNPLTDIRATAQIDSVIVRGRLLDERAIATLLARAERLVGDRDPFAGAPPLFPASEFAATFAITFRSAPFGAERVALSNGVLRAESFDPHSGQTTKAEIAKTRLLLESEGPMGRGRALLDRDGAKVHAAGTLLPGSDATLDAEIGSAVLDASGLLASRFVLLPELGKLALGESIEVREAELSLGSSLALPLHTLVVRRIACNERCFEIVEGKSPPALLAIDARGFPISYEVRAFGDVVRFERR
jgi:imidazolonepropionase-like amidohydrolase